MIVYEICVFVLGWFVGLSLAGGGLRYDVAVGREYVDGRNIAAPAVFGEECVGTSCAIDFNPVLLQGVRGYPGIRVRISQRAFQYASGLLADVINQRITKFRIPAITQCLRKVSGCVSVYNIYISRYRSPRQVVLYPAPQNRIVVQIQNVDIGITANLGGQITIFRPLPLCGIIQINIFQASIALELAVERGPRGPYLRVLSCNVQVMFADVYIENGGLIGNVVNTLLRQRFSKFARSLASSRLCGQVPSLVNEQINSRLAAFPQSIAISQLMSLLLRLLRLGDVGSTPSPEFCKTQCRGNVSINPQISESQPTAPFLSGNLPSVQTQYIESQGTVPDIAQLVYRGRQVVTRGLPQKVNKAAGLRSLRTPTKPAVHAALLRYNAIPLRQGNERKKLLYSVDRLRRDVAHSHRLLNGDTTSTELVHSKRTIRSGGYGYPAGGGYMGPILPAPPVPGASMSVQSIDLCSKCPVGGGQDNALLGYLLSNLDMRKLDDLYVSLQLFNTQATFNEFIVDISGEVSPYGRGGTPFGPFPVMFPPYGDPHMIQAIISDYTINSLLYWLHKKQFLSFRIGSDFPVYGKYLKTSCEEEEEEEAGGEGESSNGGGTPKPQLEENTRRKKALKLLKRVRARWSKRNGNRGKRQEDEDALSLLGSSCIGFLVPALGEKYPNQTMVIQVKTARAPSVIFSQARGGMVTIDLLFDADFYIEGRSNKEGTITINATLVILPKFQGNRLTGSLEISNLKISEKGTSLGSPQEALDTIASILKEQLPEMLNRRMQEGFEIPQTIRNPFDLPITLSDLQFRIIEHGIHIATDLNISPSLLGTGRY